VCSAKFTFNHVKRICAARWEYQGHSGSDTKLRCRSSLQNIIIIILSTGSRMGISAYGWRSNRLMWIIFTRSEARLVKTPHMKHSPQIQGFVKWYLGKSTTRVRLRTYKVRISLFAITFGTLNPLSRVDRFKETTH